MAAFPVHSTGVARRIAYAALLLLGLAMLVPGASQADSQVSTNGGGFVAAPAKGRGDGFSSISGTWVVPTATCTPGDQTYSAVWVGLGGYTENAKGLEQVGSEQDCDRRGRASYAAWFEILPASPVAVHMRVRPGDTVTASTTVAGHAATFSLRDLSTGARFTTTRHVSATDVSSADWIVEAPSNCSTRCSALPLTKLGAVQFTSAMARSATQTSAAGAAAWSNTTLELRQTTLSKLVNADVGTGPEQTVVSASPTPATGPYGAFTVSVTEQTTQLSVPAGPTLPGFASA